MATVGEILKEQRLRKNLTLAQVERAIKIRVSFLEFLETGNYHRLPSHTYVRGFVKNYCEYLGLPLDSLLPRLRRELDERHSKILPKRADLETRLPFTRVRVTGIFLLIISLVVLLLSYLAFQYRSFVATPKLSISTPKEGEIIRDSTVTVTGKTDPDAAVTINAELVSLDKEGKFEKKLTAFKGTFTFTVVSTNRFNKKTEVTRTVIVE